MSTVIWIRTQEMNDTAPGVVAFTLSAPDLFGIGATADEAHDDMADQFDAIVWH